MEGVKLIGKFFKTIFGKKAVKEIPSESPLTPNEIEAITNVDKESEDTLDILKIAEEEPIIKPRNIYEIHGLFLHWWRDLEDYKRLRPVDKKNDALAEKESDLSVENFEIRIEDPSIIEELDLDFENLTEEALNYSESNIPESKDAFIEPGDWFIGMSLAFTKSIKKIDKKLKGRILDAISNLSKDPVKPQGKTIKPLSANLKGFWSCKIGQSHRLIYKPDSKTKTVILMAYMPRESDYKPHRI